jgi:hypothetical protein
MTPEERIEAVAQTFIDYIKQDDWIGAHFYFQPDGKVYVDGDLDPRVIAKAAILATLQSLLEPPKAIVDAGMNQDGPQMDDDEKLTLQFTAMIQAAIKEHSE